MEFELNPDERQFFDEINVTQEDQMHRVQKPIPSRQFRAPRDEYEYDVDPDAFANTNKMNIPSQPPPVEFDGGEAPFRQPEQHKFVHTGPSEGYKTIEDEKADLLNRITRLGKKGLHTSARLTVYSDIDDIRAEYKRLTYSIEAEQSIKFQRRMLVACVSGIEFMNKRFDPFDLELDGWSENVIESQEDYDTVFEELFQKYRNKVNVAPEIKLMFMVGGSAMMFHLSKTMFRSVVEPPVRKTQESSTAGQQREMRGPGIDLTSLGGGLDISSLLNTLNRPPPTPAVESEGSVSDIVSIGSEIREVDIVRKRKSPKRQKKELVIE
jgi:Family of unknown function (DUF5767)